MKKNLTLIVATLVVSSSKLLAQGAAGIDAATSEISTYVDPISNMALILGAVGGVIGGIRVYIKWNSGDQDVQKAIMGWFGACLFLVLVGIVIKAFFGV